MKSGVPALVRDDLNSRHMVTYGQYWIRTSDPLGVNEVLYH